MDICSLGDGESKVEEYFADLQAGIESLNADPQSAEDRQEIFDIKKQIVKTMVKRVTIDRNRELHAKFSLNLLTLGNEETAGTSSENSITRGQNWRVGIYTRKLDLTAPLYLTVIL